MNNIFLIIKWNINLYTQGQSQTNKLKILTYNGRSINWLVSIDQFSSSNQSIIGLKFSEAYYEFPIFPSLLISFVVYIYSFVHSFVCSFVFNSKLELNFSLQLISSSNLLLSMYLISLSFFLCEQNLSWT